MLANVESWCCSVELVLSTGAGGATYWNWFWSCEELEVLVPGAGYWVVAWWGCGEGVEGGGEETSNKSWRQYG